MESQDEEPLYHYSLTNIDFNICRGGGTGREIAGLTSCWEEILLGRVQSLDPKTRYNIFRSAVLDYVGKLPPEVARHFVDDALYFPDIRSVHVCHVRFGF